MSLKRKDSTQQNGLRVATDDPHLVSLGGGRLSTAVTIHNLPIGDTSIGSSVDCSVVICGSGVQPHHCTLYRSESGEVTLVAERDSRILVDGKKISGDTNLSQGAMLTIGKSNYLRFNNPAEAERLRSTIGSNERISMPQIDFTQDSTSSCGSSTESSPADEMMKVDPLYKSNSRNSTHTAGILDKISKAEFPSNMNNFHSPKVFTANSITVNTPAKDVLGTKFNNFTKNLTQMLGNSKSPDQRTNNNLSEHGSHQGAEAVNHSVGMAKVNNVSVVLSPKSPKVQQFSACYDRYPKPGSYGNLQVFPMNNVNTEMNTSGLVPEKAAPPPVPNHNLDLTELQRQRAQIERMQEQEISRAEHERLDEILKMCADFEQQNQTLATVQSSPIVQNRIKTNGSLPREKKSLHGNSLSPDRNGPDHTNLFFPNSPSDERLPRKPTSGYENVLIGPGRKVELSKESPLTDKHNPYENVALPKKPGYVPQSPRTRIKTCVSPKKEVTPDKKSEYDMLVQSFEDKLRMEIQLMRNTKPTNNGNDFTEVGDSSRPMAYPEPVYGTLEKRNKNVNNLSLILKKDVDAKRSETLRSERKQVLGKVREMKAKIADLHRQEDETMRELDMEKALVTAELSSEQAHLMSLQRNISTLQNKIHRMESQRSANRTMQETQQNKLKQTIDVKQNHVDGLESLLQHNQQDTSIREELNATMDDLENESKNYEDMEFQYLEEEAEWSAYHEELLHDLRTLTKMAADKTKHIAGLETQGIDFSTTVKTDKHALEQDVSQLISELQKHQNMLRTLDTQIYELTGQKNTQSDTDDDDDDNALYGGPPLKPKLKIHEQMSHSLFGSQEILQPTKKPIDIMSRSVNENMLFQNNIELRTPFAASTPKRNGLQSVDISEDITRLSMNGHEQLRRAEQLQLKELYEPTTSPNSITMLKYNLSPPFQHKSPVPPATPDEASRKANLNLSIESDDFEVNPLERRVPSQDDIDRISKVTIDAPISTQGASNKVIESIKEIERNRQLLLAQQGSQVIEHERQKMNELKKKSHDEARAQYLQLQSISSGEDHDIYTSKDRSIEHLPMTSADADDEDDRQNHNTKSPSRTPVSSPHRHSQPDFERARPLSDATSELSYDALSEKAFKSTNDIRQHDNGNQYHATQFANRHQHHQQQRNSQVSQSDSNGSDSADVNGRNSRALVAGSKRNLPKHQRPLTRYLPIMSLDLDLRQHIESAGHQVAQCPHVLLDSHSCRGYLHKLGATFHGWSRRWFLFDRQKMALIYFSDKSERKPRGGAYFSTIDEVYLDHMNTSKSGRPYCTFIVKTKKRSYHLQAASDAAARIWIDAIITGAQGNIDY